MINKPFKLVVFFLAFSTFTLLSCHGMEQAPSTDSSDPDALQRRIQQALARKPLNTPLPVAKPPKAPVPPQAADDGGSIISGVSGFSRTSARSTASVANTGLIKDLQGEISRLQNDLFRLRKENEEKSVALLAAQTAVQTASLETERRVFQAERAHATAIDQLKQEHRTEMESFKEHLRLAQQRITELERTTSQLTTTVTRLRTERDEVRRQLKALQQAPRQ